MRPFTFGVNVTSLIDPDPWLAKCRTAERLGYGLITVSDHLGGQAPFPALVAAAAVTSHVRLAPLVLNSAFWNPVLLAREVMTTARLTGGRLQVGVGSGYVRSEFEKIGVEWGTAGDRVRRLERTVGELVHLLDHPREVGDPGPTVRPPLIIGGNGDRTLRLAARHADIVSFAGAALKPGATRGALQLLDADGVEQRVRYFESVAGDREVERGILVQAVVVTDDRATGLELLRRRMPQFGVGQIAELPTVLVGTHEQIAAQLVRGRERFGFTHVCVQDAAMRDFAPVVALLKP